MSIDIFFEDFQLSFVYRFFFSFLSPLYLTSPAQLRQKPRLKSGRTRSGSTQPVWKLSIMTHSMRILTIEVMVLDSYHSRDIKGHNLCDRCSFYFRMDGSFLDTNKNHASFSQKKLCLLKHFILFFWDTGPFYCFR